MTWNIPLERETLHAASKIIKISHDNNSNYELLCHVEYGPKESLRLLHIMSTGSRHIIRKTETFSTSRQQYNIVLKIASSSSDCKIETMKNRYEDLYYIDDNIKRKLKTLFDVILGKLTSDDIGRLIQIDENYDKYGIIARDDMKFANEIWNKYSNPIDIK